MPPTTAAGGSVAGGSITVVIVAVNTAVPPPPLATVAVAVAVVTAPLLVAEATTLTVLLPSIQAATADSKWRVAIQAARAAKADLSQNANGSGRRPNPVSSGSEGAACAQRAPS